MIIRFRFRGHVDTLKALGQLFRDRPRQPLTVGELADLSGRPFADVHARLSQVPEMFTPMPPKPNSNKQYRLTLRMERLSPDAAAAFIEGEARSETRIAVAFASAFGGLAAMLIVISSLS